MLESTQTHAQCTIPMYSAFCCVSFINSNTMFDPTKVWDTSTVTFSCDRFHATCSLHARSGTSSLLTSPSKSLSFRPPLSPFPLGSAPAAAASSPAFVQPRAPWARPENRRRGRDWKDRLDGCVGGD